MIKSLAFVLQLAVLLASVQAAPAPPPGNSTCAVYVVPGQPGGFTKRTVIDFSKASGGSAAAFLAQHEMGISNDLITHGPIPHAFTSNNVALGSGTLNLKVSAYSGSGSVQSAEISTNERFKYGSIRTVVRSSPTPGVCEGFFTYAGDTQESDWEILTSTTMKSSGPAVPKGIWASNQALEVGGKSTSKTIPLNSNPSNGFHELRLDWFPGSTTFFYDKERKARHTTNVPNADSKWVVNAWSNGDKSWSAGPPAADSITRIRSIVIYNGYTTSTGGGATCNI
ncbi:concanavalin A-like lectin/glucanase domain-containing protein [Infundibulicybe gibba]|nr:concanavalin A-like lectin/glucanase domain-containing protein [Infundibulicybe gibba]